MPNRFFTEFLYLLLVPASEFDRQIFTVSYGYDVFVRVAP